MTRVRVAIVGIFLLFGIIYSTSEIFQYRYQRPGAFYFDGDEVSYATRLARILQGHHGSGAPWLFEHRNESVTIPTLIEQILAAPVRLGKLNIDTDQIVRFSRVIFPALAFLSLYWLVLGLGTQPLFSVFLSAFVLLEANPATYMPFSAWFTMLEGFGINRFWNPMVPLVFFFSAMGLGVRAFLRVNWKLYATLCGIVVGLTFYTSIYYWTHLVLGFALAALFSKKPRAWFVLAVIGVSAAAVAFPYLLTVLKIQSNPNYLDFKWRNAIFISERAWYYLWSKKQWFFTSVAIIGLFSPRKLDGFSILIAFIISGLLLLDSSVILGRSIQNYHWHHELAPLTMVGAYLSISFWFLDWKNKWIPDFSIVPLLSIFLGLAIAFNATGLLKNTIYAYEKRSVQSPYMGIGNSDQPYFEAWNWFRINASPNSVILASETTLATVPIHSGLWVWIHPNVSVDLVSMEEIYDRYQVLWSFEGLIGQGLFDEIKVPDDYSVPSWPYGLPKDIHTELIGQGRPNFEAPIRNDLYKKLVQRQSLLTEHDVIEIGHKYKLDYVVRGPNEKRWSKLCEKLLILKVVGDFGTVRVDRVLGWSKR
jgi:hypothetical protein